MLNEYINSLRREPHAELLSESTLVNRLVHSVNIATYDQKGGSLSGWKYVSVCSIRSAKYRSIMVMISSGKTSALTKDILIRRWGCGLKSAKNTLKVTIQFGIRNVIHPYDKWYTTIFDPMHLPT